MDPNNAQAKQGLQAVQEAIKKEEGAAGAGADMGLGGLFKDPSWMAKLLTNPKTAPLLQDQTLLAQIQKLASNPNDPTAMQEALKDPRMMQVIGVLLGLNIDINPGAAAASEGDTPMPDAPPPKPESPPKPKEPEPAPEPEPEPEDDDTKAAKEAKEKADSEKALGTENYKKRNFDAAIEHYSKAWELHKDITYLNNLAAAKFEKGDLEGCIQECQRAIEEGREMRADFKLIAKYVKNACVII